MPDVRLPAAVAAGCKLCLGLVEPDVAAAFPTGGVFVLDVDVLETPLLVNCFVGDFVGDLRPLILGLPAGVGLPVIALALPAPARLCLFTPLLPCWTPAGLLSPTTPLSTALTIRCTPAGLKNMPYPCSHSKYLCPLTEPSFLPVASSSSTPTQSPVWKVVVPTKRTVAIRPSFSSILWPTTREDAFIVGFAHGLVFY